MNAPTRRCLCGCGTPVTSKWVRGHAARGEGGYRPGGTEAAGTDRPAAQPIPPPDDPWWEEDGGGPHADPGVLEPAPEPVRAAASAAGPGYEPGPAADDPPPAHADRAWKRAGKAREAPRAAPVRVTAGVRKDVTAKLSILLGVPGSVWQARDPVCGGTFMDELPNIAAAFASFVCESPDLLEWFTGQGGRFMLVLDILAALMPVGTVVMAHHVYHSIELAPDAVEAAETQYAA